MSFWGWVLYIYSAAAYYGSMVFLAFALVAWIYFGGREAFSMGGIFLNLVIILAMAALTKGYFGWFAPGLRYVETVERENTARLKKIMSGMEKI